MTNPIDQMTKFDIFKGDMAGTGRDGPNFAGSGV